MLQLCFYLTLIERANEGQVNIGSRS